MIESLLGTIVGFFLGLAAWGIQGILSACGKHSAALDMIRAEAADAKASVLALQQVLMNEPGEEADIEYDRCQRFINYPLPSFRDDAYRSFAPHLLGRSRRKELPALCEFHRNLATLFKLHEQLRGLWTEDQDNWRAAAGGMTTVTYQEGDGGPSMPFRVYSKHNWMRIDEVITKLVEGSS